jgi:hypothetical protein
LTDDLNWRTDRNNSLVARAIDALNFFGVTVDQGLMNAIDAIRERVNSRKHDPLSFHVEKSEYDAAVEVFEQFWDTLLEIEAKQFA